MANFALRLPDALYEQIALLAAADRRSINNYVVDILSRHTEDSLPKCYGKPLAPYDVKAEDSGAELVKIPVGKEAILQRRGKAGKFEKK